MSATTRMIIVRASLLPLTFLMLALASLASAAPPLPRALEDWRAWVLDREDYRQCPFAGNRNPADSSDFVCAWPGRLEISVSPTGGSFSQRWLVLTESWIAFPGNRERWPRNLMLNGRPAPVVERNGVPMVRVAPGSYVATGGFQWSSRPESLEIPASTALVALSVDAQPVAYPEVEGNSLWLGKRRTAVEAQSLEVQVYRLIRDSVPAELVTRIQLRVAGEGREELLAAPLPAGFTPAALDSPLPARLEPDGRLRLQVRAGAWTVTYRARGPGVADKINVNPKGGAWPREEIWCYEADDRLRIAAVEGVESVNPEQANVPADWRRYPAYRVPLGSTVSFAERSRGLATDNGNDLSLARSMWLAFDHSGFVVVDHIGGRMMNGWRLDLATPYRLESARVDEDNLLVTRGAKPGTTGIEVRTPNVSLMTVAEIGASHGRLPATGWSERFRSVRGDLNLPPGHRLLKVLGAEESPGAWLDRWTLLQIFLVLVTAVATARLAGRWWGLVMGAALVLTYQEAGAASWLWINLIIGIALSRFAPEGWLRTTARWYRALSFLAILLWFVPFGVDQIRLALYPQLEQRLYEIPYALEGRMAGEAAPAAAPPPPQVTMPAAPGVSAPAQKLSRSKTVEEVVVTGERRAQEAAQLTPVSSLPMVTSRYAPGTQLQAGPGIPDWSYERYSFSWSGPVAPADSVRFLILGPGALALWRILAVLLSGAALLAFAHSTFKWPARWPGAAASATALLMAVILLPAVPQVARAESTPDSALLSELKARMLRPPQCVPNCADISRASIETTPESLAVTLSVSALADDLAVPVPQARARWQPDSVTVDGDPGGLVFRARNGELWVRVRSGVHSVRMSGRLQAADSVQLVFPQRPHAIAVSGTGWTAGGISEGRLLTDSLELVRLHTDAGPGRAEVSSQFPPFVRVTRHFVIGLDWNVLTRVERIAPERGAFTLDIPTLTGESVLTADFKVKNGKVEVPMPAGEDHVEWTSSFKPTAAIALAMPSNVPWTEVWSFSIANAWSVSFAGVPAVGPEDSDADIWVFEYYPRAGETLKVAISRPDAASGTTLAIDAARLTSSFGKRASEHELDVRYRSTEGGRHVVKIPADARVTQVKVDDEELMLRPEKGELPLALLPGAHRVHVAWESDDGAHLSTRTPAVDLGAPASNITTRLALPQDRWLLFVSPTGVGPVVLYWGELLVFVLIAVVVSRIAFSPLRMHQWLFLGLGLSTFRWATLVIFALWAFAMRWREGWSGEAGVWRYRAVQMALAILTLIAIGGLVSAIPYGLLATPDMSVRGAGSTQQELSWFVDRVSGSMPAPSAISISLWWYKAAMLAWALWLTTALLRWLPWAWRAFNVHGIWRSFQTRAATAPRAPVPPVSGPPPQVL